MKSEDMSKTVYISRFIAVICVVCAHSNFAQGEITLTDRFIDSFANAGVALFFVANGIYFQRCDKNILRSLRKVFVPWLFIGTLVYILNCILVRSISVKSYVLWIIGCGSYLWFLTIYIMLLVLIQFLHIDMSQRWQVMCIIICVVSRLCYAGLGLFGPIGFLNPINWIGFMGLGLLLKERFSSIFVRKTLKISCCSFAIVILAIYIDSFVNGKIGYFGFTSVISQYAWVMLILACASIVNGVVSKYSAEIGKNSLPIYLIHIPFINFISNYFGISGWLSIVLSLVIVLMLYILLVLLYHLAEVFNLHRLYVTVTGFKRRINNL